MSGVRSIDSLLEHLFDKILCASVLVATAWVGLYSSVNLTGGAKSTL